MIASGVLLFDQRSVPKLIAPSTIECLHEVVVSLASSALVVQGVVVHLDAAIDHGGFGKHVTGFVPQ